MNPDSSSSEEKKSEDNYDENNNNNNTSRSLSITFFLREQQSDDTSLSYSDHHRLLGGLEMKEAPDGILVLQREECQKEKKGIIPPFEYARLECIHFHPHDDDSSIMIHTYGISPSTDSQYLLDGIVEKLYQTKNAFVTMRLRDIQEDETIVSNHNEAIVIKPDLEPDLDLGIQFTSLPKTDKENTRLIIESIHPSSWLYNSCLEPGQVLLNINGTSCGDFSPEDAQILLQCKKEASPVVNIQTLPFQGDDDDDGGAEPQRRSSRIKRAAVAVSGSTMVGVGSVLMVTPLHPVGHAMALGGVGVLATEFKGPRKALSKVTGRFRRNSSASKVVGGEDRQEQVCCENDCSNRMK